MLGQQPMGYRRNAAFKSDERPKSSGSSELVVLDEIIPCL